MKRIYVVTANKQYFDVWCHDNGHSTRSKDVVYVNSPEILMGLSGKNIEFAYYYAHMHPQFREIYENVKIVEATARH